MEEATVLLHHVQELAGNSIRYALVSAKVLLLQNHF